jgi:glycosyltransferase involved in cell wall biosynthesis
MKDKANVCIDLTNIIPGKGGSGGGIATYSINLVKHLDSLLEDKGPTVYCLKNSKYKGLDDLKNIKVIPIDLNNDNLFSRMLWLNVRLPYFCRSHKIDLLHRTIPELPTLKVCKYMVTMHDFMFDLYLDHPHLKKYLSAKHRFKFHFLRRLSRLAISSSDTIIVPAETIKKELEQKLGSHHRVVVIHEASEKVDIRLLKEKDPDAELKIGVIAGFFPHKGHLKVLDLAQQFLNAGFTKFKIYFRGSQVYKNYVDEIQDTITEKGLSSHVKFEAFKVRITLEEIYSDYDYVLLLSEYEGFGLPVLEAQAHSVPVICSDIPIFRENLRDSALYLKQDGAEEEIHNLIGQLTDREIREKMALAGDENVKRFSWGKMAVETLSSYRSLL